MKENKKEEVHSRREFFKKAAKSILPAIAVIALANSPVLAKASEVAMGCNNGCTTTCSGKCKGACSSCSAGCAATCLSGSK